MNLVPVNNLTNKSDYILPNEVEALWPQISEMSDFMTESKGVGLAAPQIGLFKRFFVGRTTENPRQTFVWFNPSYNGVKNKGKQFTSEGCLSYPGRTFRVERWKVVKARYHEYNWTTKRWNSREKTLTGFLAILYQHETDHLNGITIEHIGVENVKTESAGEIEGTTLPDETGAGV